MARGGCRGCASRARALATLRGHLRDRLQASWTLQDTTIGTRPPGSSALSPPRMRAPRSADARALAVDEQVHGTGARWRCRRTRWPRTGRECEPCRPPTGSVSRRRAPSPREPVQAAAWPVEDGRPDARREVRHGQLQRPGVGATALHVHAYLAPRARAGDAEAVGRQPDGDVRRSQEGGRVQDASGRVRRRSRLTTAGRSGCPSRVVRRPARCAASAPARCPAGRPGSGPRRRRHAAWPARCPSSTA